jgi:predicted transcriptional regulator
MTMVPKIAGKVKQRVLLFIAEKDQPVSFTQVWKEGKIAQSSAAKFLKELEEKSLIKKEANGSYVLTDAGKLLLLSESVKRDVENLALEKEDLIELERQLDRLPTVRTFRELIDELLSKRGPMNYRQLTEEILKVKQTKGKTPDQTVLAILERGARGPNPKYIRVGSGTYGLNPSYQESG